MIFHSLISLYDRLSDADKVPPYGFSLEDIGFVITIDKKGAIVGQPEDLRQKIKADSFEYHTSIVPYTNKVNVRSGRGAAETPNFMVDKADYIFGMSGKAKKKVHHCSFFKRIQDVCGDSTDEGILSVKAFYEKWNPDDSLRLKYWNEMSGRQGKWIAFRLQGDTGFVHERDEVKKRWIDFLAKEEYPRGISFIDGDEHDIQHQFAQFKFGSGASLVSFNEVAYESYRKKRGENAPISVAAEFKSSTALKFLFRSKTQRLRIGDATVVFWAERKSSIEKIFGQILNPSFEDQAAANQVKMFLKGIKKGVLPNDLKNEENLKFFILGLSLNKARLALRFWFVSTVRDLMKKLQAHFSDLEMELSSEQDVQYPGIWHLLKETVRERDSKNISPVLSGSLTRSILTGANYPQSFFQSVMGRVRVDRRINYLRASIIKAVLQRNYKTEVPMSLDTERRDVAYLLGRLFAVLEKAQKEALGKINATIKDRFFSAASATPASMFPRLLRLSQHHIEKSEYGYRSDQRISEILEYINNFPSHMDLQNQGVFAIGYYHQKNAMDREMKEAIKNKKDKQTQNDQGEKND
jgi:CRISPR-associated protein Csd1